VFSCTKPLIVRSSGGFLTWHIFYSSLSMISALFCVPWRAVRDGIEASIDVYVPALWSDIDTIHLSSYVFTDRIAPLLTLLDIARLDSALSTADAIQVPTADASFFHRICQYTRISSASHALYSVDASVSVRPNSGFCKFVYSRRNRWVATHC